MLIVLCALVATEAVQHKVQIAVDVQARAEGYAFVVDESHDFVASTRTSHWSIFETAQQEYESVVITAATLNGKALKSSAISSYSPELENIFISDVKVHRVRAPTLEPGDRFHVDVRRRCEDLGFMPAYFVPNRAALGGYGIDIRHPKELTVDFDVAVLNEGAAYVVESDDATLTRFKVSRFNVHDVMQYYAFHDTAMIVVPRIAIGDRQLTCNSVDSINRWYRGRLAGLPALSPDAIAVTRSLLEGHENPRSQVGALYTFVRDEIRYVADMSDHHAIVPHDPNRVLVNRYGDCKDKAFLLKAMADSVGLDLRVALVSTTGLPPTATLRVHFFDHVINIWDPAGEAVWMDATVPSAVPDLWVPEHLASKTALVLGIDSDEMPEVLPVTLPGIPSMSVKASVDLKDLEQGSASVVVERDFSVGLESSAGPLESLEFENRISNLLTSRFVKLSLDYFRGNASGGYDCAADFSDFMVTTTRKAYVPSTPFILGLDDIWDRENDGLPVTIPQRFRVSLELELRHDGFVSTQQSLALDAGEGAQFEASLVPVGPGHSRLTYRLEFLKTRWSTDEKASLIGFVRDYLGNKNSLMTLRRVE